MTDWLRALTEDAFVNDRLASSSQVSDMLRVESVYCLASGQVGRVPEEMARKTAEAVLKCDIDAVALTSSAKKDGLPVPGLVAQIKAQIDPELQVAVHTGLTSQDVMDTAFVLAIRDILDDFESRIVTLQEKLRDLQGRFGANRLMGRTRMQAGLEIAAGHRIAQWQAPWEDHLHRLQGLRARVLRLQLGGPVGDRTSFNGQGDQIAAFMAQKLDLIDKGHAWHSDRTAFAELAAWLGGVTGSTGKIGADLVLMAQQGVDEVTMAGGGSSSAMPHKSNPVSAEVLVALARDSASHIAAAFQALVHEQERSGVAWMMEWMCLPILLTRCGAALNTCLAVVDQIESLGSRSGR